MRTPLIAGNWKMHMTEAQALVLTRKLLGQLSHLGQSDVEVLVCPPFTALSQLHKLLVSTGIKLGAQNMHWETSGAYTGEISPDMVAEFCQYVILGHSERRAYFGETDLTINHKLKSALEVGLVPIMCVGESLEENKADKTAEVIYSQMINGLEGAPVFSGEQVVVAYEPVWAIGTGLTATPEAVAETIRSAIRPALTKLFGPEVSGAVRVLYGGSVNPVNAGGFLGQHEIDGALVGGASLKPETFIGIVAAS